MSRDSYAERLQAEYKAGSLRRQQDQHDEDKKFECWIQSIVDRLVPLVNGRLEWWREVVRRWADDPPQHIEPGSAPEGINSPELRESWLRLSRQRTRRQKNEHDDEWKIRIAQTARIRENHKRLLAKAQQLDDGCPIYDERDYLVLTVPFPDTPLTDDERVSFLAAIYDTYAARVGSGIMPINPWHDLSSSTAVPYEVLLSDRVPKLREDWRTCRVAVEMFLDDVKQQLEVPAGDRGDDTPTLSKSAVDVLRCLVNRHPELCSIDVIESEAIISRGTASKTVLKLIEDGYAHRPQGGQRGATATDKGITVAAQLAHKSCAD